MACISFIAPTPPKPLAEICDTLEKSRNADFMLERNASVSFSLGADMTDKRPLGRLRFDSKHHLKILLVLSHNWSYVLLLYYRKNNNRPALLDC